MNIKLSDNLSIKGITKEQLSKIENRLPELFRAKKVIGKSTSQSSYTLQTLTMLSDSPLSRMKQCLSQIEHKYQAVQEAYFRIEKKRVEIKKWHKSNDPMSKVMIRESELQIISIQSAMEIALRSIGMFQDFYDAIRKNNGIPEKWNESDYEKQEIANMVRKSFRLGIQDITAYGRPSKASVEYWEQLGIHPQSAEAHVRNYLTQIQQIIEGGKEPTVESMYEFLDGMAIRFKDSFKFVLKRIGLDELGSEDFRI